MIVKLSRWVHQVTDSFLARAGLPMHKSRVQGGMAYTGMHATADASRRSLGLSDTEITKQRLEPFPLDLPHQGELLVFSRTLHHLGRTGVNQVSVRSCSSSGMHPSLLQIVDEVDVRVRLEDISSLIKGLRDRRQATGRFIGRDGFCGRRRIRYRCRI